MRPHTNASIINISSTSAVVSRATSVHYTASKGGVRALTQGFAAALAPLDPGKRDRSGPCPDIAQRAAAVRPGGARTVSGARSAGPPWNA